MTESQTQLNRSSRLNLRLPSPDQLRHSGYLLEKTDHLTEFSAEKNTSQSSCADSLQRKVQTARTRVPKPAKKAALSARSSPDSIKSRSAGTKSPSRGKTAKRSLTRIQALLEQCNKNLMNNLEVLDGIDEKLRSLEHQFK